ncbi:SET domain-containing protein 5 [Parachaetomium inaequale]|uniref:SET domain-containing protein 5 n=1 Tax=Parachaetomium inaequale TaxID=2588326 RepID=A0AAN6SM44_9PEZI|nr:SET domain-containing protein 5 [Parachaetomium inaequale]
MTASYPRALAAVYVVLLAPSAAATHGGPQLGRDILQQRLFGTGCLPGPFQLGSYPTCVTADNDDDAPWAPWTYRPYCADNTNYCVFTNADFQGPDRGVSVIDARPSSTGNATSAVTVVADLLSSMPPAPGLESADEQSPPYEVRHIPGKGKGLIATRKIPRGQVFMVDYAAIVADTHLPGRVKRAQGHQLLREAIERLPGAEEVLGLARSSLDPENVPVSEDVMRTNAFSVEIGGRDYMALFPRIARMNHACKPSAITRFNATTLSNTATAFHDILPNDEITISYSIFGLPSSARHETLLSKWGFTCTCALCSLPASELAESDERRVRISRLGKEVIELVEKGGTENLREAAGLYAEAVDAVREEGLVPHLGGHYEVLGRLWGASGEVERGREWVRRGREETEGFEGVGGGSH